MDAPALRACPACGLVQRIDPVPARHIAMCARCGHPVKHASKPQAPSRCAALASAALILFVPAMMLPVIEIEQFGATSGSTIWSGSLALISHGDIAVGLVVLLASIVAPLFKITALLALSTRDTLTNKRHQAMTYRAVEWLGRWGMLDVLLVAILVAAVKLGGWLEVHPGPGLAAFTAVVVLSLLASAAFDPHAIWERDE